MRLLYRFCRYFVAVVIIYYGFAKLTGAQFTILDSELDKPLRDVSGFWLTWYYFGYSTVYGSFIAVVQIVCGLMLTVRRTTLLGACILFGVVSNIVLVDIFFGVDRSGLYAAEAVWLCLVGILWWHRQDLISVFWTTQCGAAASSRTFVRRALGVTARLGLLVVAGASTYWIANSNNRLPTPLDGAWKVTASGAATSLPTHIYFEHNRAWMCVFRYRNAWITHRFEVDTTRKTIQVWEHWLSKGAVVFRGSYKLNGPALELTGALAGAPGVVELELRREK